MVVGVSSCVLLTCPRLSYRRDSERDKEAKSILYNSLGVMAFRQHAPEEVRPPDEQFLVDFWRDLECIAKTQHFLVDPVG